MKKTIIALASLLAISAHAQLVDATLIKAPSNQNIFIQASNKSVVVQSNLIGQKGARFNGGDVLIDGFNSTNPTKPYSLNLVRGAGINVGGKGVFNGGASVYGDFSINGAKTDPTDPTKKINGRTDIYKSDLFLFGGSKMSVDGYFTSVGGAAIKDLSAAGTKITNVFDGDVSASSFEAVNGRQLNTTNNRIAATNDRIDATNTAVGSLTMTVNSVKQVTDSVTANDTVAKANAAATQTNLNAERDARIEGDKRTEQASNTYTDNRITQQSGADRAYTDKAVGAERERAMAAEAAISKEVKQVGAMAMAAAGVAGATPQGDKQTAVTAAVGAYSGQTAIAVGVTRLVGEGAKIFGAFSKVSGGKTGVTVGASFSF